MRRRLSPFIALLCALVLLGAQQAAYAHWIGHLGAASTTAAALQGGNGDGDGLPHDCTTCTGLFASFGAAPPAALPITVDTGDASQSQPGHRPHQLPTHAASPYPARAPPLVL